jgi:hypothetical protein
VTLKADGEVPEDKVLFNQRKSEVAPMTRYIHTPVRLAIRRTSACGRVAFRRIARLAIGCICWVVARQQERGEGLDQSMHKGFLAPWGRRSDSISRYLRVRNPCRRTMSGIPKCFSTRWVTCKNTKPHFYLNAGEEGRFKIPRTNDRLLCNKRN